LFTVPCEAIFNRHPLVRRSALVGVGKKGRAKPVICIELKRGYAADREKLTAELLTLARTDPRTAAIDTVLYHPSFPVDIRHNAKIFREKLAVWAAGELTGRR
ncbi:MAG: peptide synthase, partial [Syntrophales bacterium]|nr:peptide synthase [Syntrophales bacterium]